MKTPTTQPCPITQVAELLSDTWTMLIMHALCDGPKRFCELEKQLGTISTRTLTLKLTKLQTNELVEKLPTGQYATTKKGAGLKIIERAMTKYSKQYLN